VILALVLAGPGPLIADLTVRDVYYHAVQAQGERDAQGLRLYNLRLVDAKVERDHVMADGDVVEIHA